MTQKIIFTKLLTIITIRTILSILTILTQHITLSNTKKNLRCLQSVTKLTIFAMQTIQSYYTIYIS